MALRTPEAEEAEEVMVVVEGGAERFFIVVWSWRVCAVDAPVLPALTGYPGIDGASRGKRSGAAAAAGAEAAVGWIGAPA